MGNQPHRDSHGRHSLQNEDFSFLDAEPSAGEQQAAYRRTAAPIDRHEAMQYRRENYSRRSRRPRRVRKIAIALVTCLIACSAFLGVSAFIARDAASTIMANANEMARQMLEGDMKSAQRSAQELDAGAQRLNLAIGNPLWAPLTLLPVYGQDVFNIRQAASVASGLSKEVLVPYTAALAQQEIGRAFREDNSLDASALQTMVGEIEPFREPVGRYAQQMELVGSSEIEQIGRQVNRVSGIVALLDAFCAVAPDLKEHLPAMLGADGSPRTYLLVAQTNAEIRATGGYPGSLGPVYIDNGHISLGEFYNIHAVKKFEYTDLALEDPVAYTQSEGHPPITQEEMTLFGLRLTKFPGDFGYNPDFSRLGESMKWAYDYYGYGDISGVLAIDPVFLQDVLSVVGGVTTTNGTTVDGTNAARMLMHDVYYSGTNDEQDAFFSETASLAFDKLMSKLNGSTLRKLAGSVMSAAQLKRLSAWMADPVEQSIVQGLGCSGEVYHDEEQPTLGVYINDDSWSKMFWYLKSTTRIGDPVKNPDGSQSYRVKTVLRNCITPEEEATLPAYVGSHNKRARSAADMVAWVYLYAPQGGSITDIEATGFLNGRDRTAPPLYGTILPDESGMTEYFYEGLEVWYAQTQIAGGESTVITYTVTTSPHAKSELLLDTTPTAQYVAGW